MLVNKKQSLLLVYTTLGMFVAISTLSIASHSVDWAQDMLEDFGFLWITLGCITLLGMGCLIFSVWNYLGAYMLAKRIFSHNKKICLTAEEILLLEKEYSLKQIARCCLGEQQGEPMLKTLSRSIVFSNSIKR